MEEQTMNMEAESNEIMISPMKPVNKLICVFSPAWLIEQDRKKNPEKYEKLELLPDNQQAELRHEIISNFVSTGSFVLAVADDCMDWAKTATKVWFRPETLMKAAPVDKEEMYLYINENFVIAIE